MVKSKVGFIKMNIPTYYNLLSKKIINFVSLHTMRITKKNKRIPAGANLSLLCFGAEIKQREPKDLR